MIHVQTSGLVYMRKLGVAATGQPAEFRYGGVTCTSNGAEFDINQSVVRLPAAVHLSGYLQNGAFSLKANHAELNQRDNTAHLAGAVLAAGDRVAQAADALLHLRRDGTLETLEASGSVELHRGTEMLGAPQATAVFAQQNRPQHARLFGGVRFTDADRAKPAAGCGRDIGPGLAPEWRNLSLCRGFQQRPFCAERQRTGRRHRAASAQGGPRRSRLCARGAATAGGRACSAST